MSLLIKQRGLWLGLIAVCSIIMTIYMKPAQVEVPQEVAPTEQPVDAGSPDDGGAL